MCGVTGILTAVPGTSGESIEAMTYALRHRGPDSSAIFVDQAAGVALGHRRLAVIELSERGAQPMRSANGRYVIVYNGEIYNHRNLRLELETKFAVAWRGASDTETLVECFSEWGVAATLKKTVGMFALALWDRAERRLTLARDRFGEKPLYYGYVGHGASTALIFGSELKALRACSRFANAIDRDALELYLRYSYVPTPYSIYRDIYKLEPGAMFEIAAVELFERPRRVEQYWRYEDVAAAGLTNPFVDEREAIEALEHALSDAVRLQLVADVPVGAFLSGGIDSSTIVALMQAQSSRPVRTFTVVFDEAGFDEVPRARAVAQRLGTTHCEIRVTPKEARAVIPTLPLTYDEPFGDSSQIPTSVVCAVARREVTVALSGDAGDEVLGGYNRYVIGPMLWRRLAQTPSVARNIIGAVAERIGDPGWAALALLPGLAGSLAPFKGKAYKLSPILGNMCNVDDFYMALATEWSKGATPALGATGATARFDDAVFANFVAEPTQRMMLLDGVSYLPDDILAKLDRAAMAVSLETRVPLLDHRVAEVAWRLPLSMKIRGGQGKWALRQVLYRYLPRELVERPKAGFAIPIGQWLRESLRDWADDLLSDRRLRDGGYLDVVAIRRLWAEHRCARRDWTARLWNVLMFQSWLSETE
jgi:asparagine synthase (glutamine-hydrolysing)